MVKFESGHQKPLMALDDVGEPDREEPGDEDGVDEVDPPPLPLLPSDEVVAFIAVALVDGFLAFGVDLFGL